MSVKTTVRRRNGKAAQRSASANALKAFFLSSDGFDSLGARGYSTLLSSPDVAAGVSAVADVVSNATIQLMRNTPKGDRRERNELSRFIDIHPYSLGTRQSFVSWIVTTMMTSADGSAFVLPITRDGYLEDLVPMPGATATASQGGYVVHWQGQTFAHDEILAFILRPDIQEPWRGRGIRIQLKDVLQNLRQSAVTTNSFLSDKWKPSVIVKVDALAEEFASQEGRQKLLDSYIKNQRAGEPWVIPAELMDVTTVKPLSLADLAISDNVEMDKRAVAAAIGVPPFLLGVGSYNQDEYNAFIRRTVIPIANIIAQTLTKGLLINPDLYFRISERKLYAYSMKELAEVADNQFVRGLMTGNEVRDWLNQTPMEGLDQLVILENFIPANMIGDQKKLKNKEDG